MIIRATQGPKDAYEQVKEYADQVDLIACSGGDGTLDEVVTGIVEVGSQTPIGYIPAGSTNDFANSLFINLITRHLPMWLRLDCLPMFPMRQTRI